MRALRSHKGTLDASDVVVVDECDRHLDVQPTHAWMPIGEHASSSAPRNTPINTTIASLTATGMGPARVVTGGVDQATFNTYLEQVLDPSLRAGPVVLVDNVCAHTSKRAHEMIAARGGTLRYLPTYSPDLSPIALACAKMKAALRRAAARCRDTLEIAIAVTLSDSTPADARAFFKHGGYHFLPNRDQWFCSSL